MVAIVVAVGSTRSWGAALVGPAGGLVVLAALITALGTALRDVALQPIRLVVGALLLVFGLQWLRKGVLRIAAQGWGVGGGGGEGGGGGRGRGRAGGAGGGPAVVALWLPGGGAGGVGGLRAGGRAGP